MSECKFGKHQWQKREKQWIGKDGKVYITKKCNNCGALKGVKKIGR